LLAGVMVNFLKLERPALASKKKGKKALVSQK